MSGLNKKLSLLMVSIVAATQSEAGMLMVKKSDAQILTVAALVETNPAVVEGDKIATRATPEAIAQFGPKLDAEGNPIPVEVAAAPAAKPSFAIADGIAIPDAKRGGRTSEMYPFDQLEINGSFFVPATASKPEPAKSLASTVTSANDRHSVVDPSGAVRTTRKGNTVPVKVPQREFTMRAVADGAPWGQPGVAGAGIWRTK